MFLRTPNNYCTCVLEKDLVHVCAGVLEQLVAGVEDYNSDLTVAQDAQLVRLFQGLASEKKGPGRTDRNM